VVILSTAMFDGPLAAFRVFPRNTHRLIDAVVSVGLVAVAVSVDVGAATRLTLLGAATVLLFMSVRFTHGIRETRT
jgi:hypothetical protein